MNKELKNEYKLPVYVTGIVVKGFGRGSHELGIRTANYNFETVKNLSNKLKTGVYIGYCTVESYNGVFECVVNAGWCPFYKNEHISIEAHILHEFNPLLFYGKEMKLIFLKYLRNEMNFNSVDELIDAIKNDIKQTKILLSDDKFKNFKSDNYFKNN